MATEVGKRGRALPSSRLRKVGHSQPMPERRVRCACGRPVQCLQSFACPLMQPMPCTCGMICQGQQQEWRLQFPRYGQSWSQNSSSISRAVPLLLLGTLLEPMVFRVSQADENPLYVLASHACYIHDIHNMCHKHMGKYVLRVTVYGSMCGVQCLKS